MRLKHAAVPAAALALSFGALMAPAQADGHIVMRGNAEHCNPALFPNKVEVDAGKTYKTGLPDGTEVCIKAGRTVELVTAEGKYGKITSGNGKGISYYAYGDVEEPPCEDDPYTPEDECDEGSGPVS
jgi:hypothetical protein